MDEPCPELAIINDVNIKICKNGKTNMLIYMENYISLPEIQLELNQSLQTTNNVQQSQQFYQKQQKQEQRLLIKWKE
jgi:hypothetical protein